ncbi:MAG: hypothetical protein JO218_03515 [Burkholderiales bacterium]|nr:hypothetical protein [Burkholderiales bacterium]
MKRILRNPQLWLDLLVSGLLPWLVYQWVEPRYGEVRALWCSALPPAVLAVIELILVRRVDVISALSLGGIGVSLLIDGTGGDARMILVRESILTGAIGVMGLLTLLWRRPAAFLLARAAYSRGDVDRGGQFDANWQHVPFRRLMWMMTVVWSGGLVLEAVLRTALAWRVPADRFLALSPFVQYGTFALLFAWTWWYGRRLRTAQSVGA